MPKVWLSSTVMTPSLPTLSMASEIIWPISSSAAEMEATWAICSLESTSLARSLIDVDGGVDGGLDALLQAHRVGAGGHVAQALVHHRPGQHGGGGGAVTGDVVGLLGDFLDQLGADLLVRVLEVDLLGDGDAVVGDGGRAPLLLQHDVAALRAERDADGVGELVHARLEGTTSLLVEGDHLRHRCVLRWTIAGGGSHSRSVSASTLTPRVLTGNRSRAPPVRPASPARTASRLAERAVSQPKRSGGWRRSSAAGDGGDDRDRLAVGHRRVEALEVAHVVVGHEHVDEAAQAALVVEQAVVEAGVGGVEAGQHLAERARPRPGPRTSRRPSGAGSWGCGRSRPWPATLAARSGPPPARPGCARQGPLDETGVMDVPAGGRSTTDEFDARRPGRARKGSTTISRLPAGQGRGPRPSAGSSPPSAVSWSRTAPLVDEILVVDDGSTDDTAAVAAAAGARVARPREPFAELGARHRQGRGAVEAASRRPTGDLVVWCDADITDFDTRFVVGLVGPLLVDPTVRLRQGLLRPARRRHAPGTGGRTTELVARPVISLLFPSPDRHRPAAVGRVRRPARACSRRVPFVQGYGVDLGLLIDIEDRFGAGRHRPGRPGVTAPPQPHASTSSRRRRSRSCRRRSPAPVCRPAAPPRCGGPACRLSRCRTSSGRPWPTCAPNAGVEPAPDRHRLGLRTALPQPSASSTSADSMSTRVDRRRSGGTRSQAR